MISYEATGVVVTVESRDKFRINDIARGAHFNREQMTELRSAIDKALNISAEELGDECR